MPIPDFGQLVEYRDRDGIHQVALAQHDLSSPFVLVPVAADYGHVEQLGRGYVINTAALRGSLAGHYADDVLAAEVVSTNPAVVVERLAWVHEHREWRPGLDVARGEVLMDEGTLWRVVQDHTTQSDWRPGATPALFARYYNPTETPAWVQPTGAQDSWPLGAHVTHGGHEWESLIADNVWEPGVVGSEALWSQVDEEPPTGEWVSGEQGLVIGDLRTYQGATYRVRQNPGINIWPPPTVPALWELVP